MTQVKTIADAIVDIIQALAGAPSTVEWRKTEVWHPYPDDPETGIVITAGPEKPTTRFTGRGVVMEYPFQVSYFKSTTPDVAADDVNPAFFQLVKNALGVTALSGADRVWDFELAERSEWESVPFRDGTEVSRFGVLYRTSEPSNG